jgi:hypothetical protein
MNAQGVSPDAVPARALDARIRNIGDGLLVAGPAQVLELRDTATFVWSHIDGRRTVAELGEALAAEYDVDASTATADVAELLGDLASAGVVTLTDGG